MCEHTVGGGVYSARIAQSYGVRPLAGESLRHLIMFERFSSAVLNSASCSTLLA